MKSKAKGLFQDKDSFLIGLAAFPLIAGVVLVSAIPTVLAIGSAFTDLVL